MNSLAIYFHSEEIDFVLLKQQKVINWITKTILLEHSFLKEINFIFCSDDYLLKVNREYLSHDYYTDVITFDYSEKNNIAGDIFISIDRVEENAKYYKKTKYHELLRIIIHGVLHLLSYKDKTEIEKTEMTNKENFYLSLFNSEEE